MPETKPSVLIVDDEPVILVALEIAFEDSGFTVATAKSAPAALARFEEARYDLLICDKNMPGMNGVELIGEIRPANPDLAIVLITAYGSAESARETLNLGIDAYLEKPFPDVFAVVAVGKEAIRKRRLPPPERPRLPMAVLIVAKEEWMIDQLAEPVDRGRSEILRGPGSVEEIVTSMAKRRPDLVVVDAGSYGDEVAALVIAIRGVSRDVPLVISSPQPTGLSMLTKLIGQGVTALCDSREDYVRRMTQLVDKLAPR